MKMQKPEWEQKLPAGYRMATESDRGAPIGEDWKAWSLVSSGGWIPVHPTAVGDGLRPHKETPNEWCHVPMCIPIRGDVGEGYRELDLWEIVHHGTLQQAAWCGRWRPLNEMARFSEFPDPPKPYSWYREEGSWTIRVPVEAPSSYPPLSPEAKDSMEQDAKAMQGVASSAPAESPERKETGYTVDEVRAAQSPEGMKKVQRIASHASEELDKLADRIFMGQAPSIDPESDVPTYNNACTHVTIPVSHPWVPKPFTPNKYTRNMPTLDGRTVPVDVYCVLAAFPTGSAAVDHAIKKLLAPGQRGHKDRIQDLKEACASLTRAIELEEAQNA